MLYDLTTDPGENVNISELSENADLVAGLLDRIYRGRDMAKLP